MAGRRDRRRDRAKRIAELVKIGPGSIGEQALGYLEHLRRHNYSPHTIRGTRTHLRLFLVWCEERGVTRLEELSLALLKRYQAHLFHFRKENGRPLSVVSQGDRMGGVRRFSKWLWREGLLDENLGARITLPRTPRRLPRNVLTAEEAEAILALPDVETLDGLRDRAILEVFYSTGIRRGELETLRIDDVDFSAGLLRIEEGKGQKDRYVPLSERAAAWVQRYLEEARPKLLRRPEDEPWLFLKLFGGGRLQGGRLGRIVRDYVRASGVPKEGSCHMFRHTMATLMLEGGADIRFVQTMLGHSTLQTTEIYTHVALGKLKEVHARSHPGAKLHRPLEASEDDEQTEIAPEDELLSSLAAEEEEEGAAIEGADGEG